MRTSPLPAGSSRCAISRSGTSWCGLSRFHSIGGWGMITTGKNLGEIIGNFGQIISERNPTDDDMQEVQQDSADDPVATELRRVLDGLSAEEQAGLVAMAWLGRGDGGIGEWPELLAEARRRHEQPTGAYLLGMPLLADHLESALEAFGGSCAETEADRL